MDTATQTLRTPKKIGSHISQILLSTSSEPGLANVLLATTDAGLVVLDAGSLAVRTTVPLTGNPWAIGINPATGSIFVSQRDANTVALIDGYSFSQVASIPVVQQPTSIAVVTSNGALTAGEHKVYVTGNSDSSATVFIDPAVGKDLITLPVRWCAMEGSVAAKGTTVPAGQRFTTGNAQTDAILLGQLRTATSEVWIKQNAHLAFRAAVAEHFPIIADPDPSGELGEVLLGIGESETTEAGRECEEAWDALAHEQRGIIAVNVQNFSSMSAGVTPQPEGLRVGQARNSDLCVVPRRILTSDVVPLDVKVADPSEYSIRIHEKGNRPGLFQTTDPTASAVTLAHELGHSLLLGHGDGLDNNHDGLEPPAPGPRRYDGYCDPLGVDSNDSPKEDLIGDQPTDACPSVMEYSGTCRIVRALQVETARDAATLVPGNVVNQGMDPAGWVIAKSSQKYREANFPRHLEMTKVTVSQTPRRGTTEISAKLAGRIMPRTRSQYLFFLDLDGNAKTGCKASVPGLPTTLEGAELTVRIIAEAEENAIKTTTEIEGCREGRLQPIYDKAVVSLASNTRTADGIDLPSGNLEVVLPGSFVWRSLRSIRLAAASSLVGGHKPWFQLPEASSQGLIVSLIPPELPSCSTSLDVARTGEPVAVDATDLAPNQAIDLFLGTNAVAQGQSDSSGKSHTLFTISSDQTPGLQQISVVTHGTALTATCALLISGRPPIAAKPRLWLASRVEPFSSPGKVGSEVTITTVARIPLSEAVKLTSLIYQFDPHILKFDHSSALPSKVSEDRILWNNAQRKEHNAAKDPLSFSVSATFRVVGCPSEPSSTVLMTADNASVDSDRALTSTVSRQTVLVDCKRQPVRPPAEQ
jgi:hypothetical protein